MSYPSNSFEWCLFCHRSKRFRREKRRDWPRVTVFVVRRFNWVRFGETGLRRGILGHSGAFWGMRPTRVAAYDSIQAIAYAPHVSIPRSACTLTDSDHHRKKNSALLG